MATVYYGYETGFCRSANGRVAALGYGGQSHSGMPVWTRQSNGVRRCAPDQPRVNVQRFIEPSQEFDVVMVAPKSRGHLVRRLYVEGQGFRRLYVEGQASAGSSGSTRTPQAGWRWY